MDNADLIAALDLVVNTGHATTDEHGNPHWAISERQRDIARSALDAARGWPPGRGYAQVTTRLFGEFGVRCWTCKHDMRVYHNDWTAIVCTNCKLELYRGPR